MENVEVLKLLTLVRGSYQHWASNIKPRDAEAMVKMWSLGLQGVEYQEAEKAVIKHCTTSKWVPSIADIVDLINLSRGIERESEATVLAEITVAVLKSYKDEQIEYQSLSNTAKQVVRDPFMIREWRNCERFSEIVAPGLRKVIKEQIETNFSKVQMGIPIESIEYEAKIKIPKKIEPRLGENRITEISKDEIEEAIRRLKGGA